MKLLRRIKAGIYTFFRVDVPMFWNGRSLFGKISLGCFGAILVQFLIFAVVFCFAILMSRLNSNKSYEILYPVEQIKSIEIIHVDGSLSLYNYPLDEIAEIVRQHTISSIPLDDAAVAACTDDLFALSASKWWNDPSPCIKGGTLLITYENGSFELICAYGTFYYDADSSETHLTWYYFNRKEFDSFLQKYGYQPPK